MKTNVNVIAKANGLYRIEYRGKTIGNDIPTEQQAHLEAHHFAHAPSLAKRLGFKKLHGSVDGTICARPFWGVRVEIVKTDDGLWQTLCEVDGEQRYFEPAKTKNAAIQALLPLGDEMLVTRNILNPTFGDIPISRSSKGGCCDPGTERYHAM